MAKVIQLIYAHLPVAVCAVAAILAPSLQLVKAYVPKLTGWKALAANFVLSVLGVFAITPPGQFWTVDAWARVVLATLTAAGLYHTAQSLSAPANKYP